MRRTLLGFMAAALLLGQCAPDRCAPPPPPTAEVAWATFDLELSSRLLGGGDDAVSVTVHVDGALAHTAAYGRRLPWSDEPAAPTHRLRIASISKVITAIVVLQLVEAGHLGLDDSAGGALAQRVGASPVDFRVAGITVRQLLSHTSGLASYQSLMLGGVVDSCAAAGRHGLSAPLAHAPGSTYTYSNLNYCLLGLFVEQVTGRPYEAVVNDWLLGPLGITGMRLAGTYDVGPSDVFHRSKPNRNYMEVLGASGSWLATSSDVVKIVDSLDPATPGFHPLSAAMTDTMRRRFPFVYDPGRWYGLGLICFDDGSWGHTGTLEGAHGIVLHRPDGITWSILVSGEHPAETDDLRVIFDEVVAQSSVLRFLR